MDYIALGLAWYAVFIISLTFHEAAHGLAAIRLGDPTAYNHGQVTLDPVAHIKRETVGMVVVPIISFIMGGWMIGWASTPVDLHWTKRYPRKAALMALAGPAANFALLIVAAIAIRAGLSSGIFHAPAKITFDQVTSAESAGLANSAAVIISILFSLNLVLLVFNLIPLPPLDGSSILMLFLSDSAADRYNRLIESPRSKIIGIIVAWHVLTVALYPIRTFALNLLYPGAGYH